MKARDDETTAGRVLLFTGEGKGKTTAAMGQVLRLVGHGRRVLVVQFGKGSRDSGERDALARFGDLVTVIAPATGWLDLSAQPRRAEDLEAVRETWRQTLRLVDTGDFDAVVLDEIAFVVAEGFLPVDDVLAFLGRRPRAMTVVMTGRGAAPELVDRADTVTEMRKIRHPFDEGRRADAGIEY
ncbi:MAG TPA: cob(I)yrinic acid a,c-diamide adenosyltransferase [Planctomycetota bacterium]|nr:cob(I)yrinic acid a,c-diamide adenosyltransferase [Planctomycetota bacterium]